MPNGQGEVTAQQRAMLQMPTPTYGGAAIKVQWTLRVIHKHNSWNEFGEGISIDVPIKIVQNYVQPANLQTFNAVQQQAVYQ